MIISQLHTLYCVFHMLTIPNIGTFFLGWKQWTNCDVARAEKLIRTIMYLKKKLRKKTPNKDQIVNKIKYKANLIFFFKKYKD